MKHLKKFKLFEEAAQKPVKKFPTEPAIHWNYLMKILEEVGMDEELIKGQRDTYFQDFCFAKCASRDNVVFPKMLDIEGWSKEDQEDYKNFIFGESVFLLPISYDPSNDATEAAEKKKGYLDRMRGYAKQMGKNKEEQEKFVQDAEKHTHFGPSGYDWANPALKVIHDKLGQYYQNGKLRVWFPKDRDYDPWEGMDYPHKYNVVGDLDHPNGVYYLSDIEKYIDYKYGIKDDLFYQFLIDNQYIEGRYWERVWSLPTEDLAVARKGKKGGSKNKLQKSGFGKYGMEPTEDISHILNIIEKEFGDEISGTDYEGFPIYVDYYKKVKPKY
jgi:hypothetical protein